MNEITIDQATMGFSEVAEQITSSGESVIVTRDGKPVLQISSQAYPPVDRQKRQDFIRRIEELRKTVRPASQEELRRDINEGRR